MKKKKLIKLFIYSLILFLFISIIIIIIKHPKNYTINYSINDFQIEEQYNKNLGFYNFKIAAFDTTYNFLYQNKYISKNKLIKNIKSYETDNTKCLLLENKYFDNYPICYDGKSFIDYDLLNNKDENFFKRITPQNKNIDFKNINIINTQENNYLVWASKGFYFISDDSTKELMFLEHDSYYNNLSYQIDNLIITPNYDEDYTFSRVFITDLKKGKTKTWNIDYNINFNSYYLGDKDGKVYLFDRKEKIEYAINPKNKKIEIVNNKNASPKIWNDGWEEVSTTKLANEDYHFIHKNNYQFDTGDREVTLKFPNSDKIIISNKNKAKIISMNNESTYYLSEDTLYEYSLINGERPLLKYNEWNFNNINAVFVYKK